MGKTLEKATENVKFAMGMHIYGSRRKKGSPVISFRCPARYQVVIDKAKTELAKKFPEHFPDAESVPDSFVMKYALELMLYDFDMDVDEIPPIGFADYRLQK